jgi:hypothetical protein
MRQATDREKYFIYKTRQLMTDQNKPKLEGVIKAFGLIHDVETSLTDEDNSKFEAIDELENMRGDTAPKAFFESLCDHAIRNVDRENIGEVRKSLNYYRNWLTQK